MEVTKAAGAARTSSLFSRVTHLVLADLAIVHPRRATMGLPVADCNALLLEGVVTTLTLVPRASPRDTLWTEAAV
jgi:hypothetical protein